MKINNLFKSIAFIFLVGLFSCSTVQQTSCPSFKSKANKAAIAQAKMKQKEHKKMAKHKAYLSEKYAANSDKEGVTGIALNNVIDQHAVALQIINPIQSIENVQLASINSNFDLLTPTEYTLSNNFVAINKPVKKQLTEKQQQRFQKIEAKIEKVKQKINRKKVKKSPKPIGGGDDRKAKIGGILGILSLLIPILAIPGIILSFMGLQSSRRGLAIAGIVCSVIALIWLIAFIL